MLSKTDVIEQTKIAFDFMQKLYSESSYLIKEIEGILSEEEEKFIISRPAGYGISSRSSTGLESNNVNLWLLKKFSVSFIEKEKTKTVRGQTVTNFSNTLKTLYLRIILNDKLIKEPLIYSGVMYNIESIDKTKWIKKYENIMGHIEYNDQKIFKNLENISYEDSYLKFKGKFKINKLFDLSDGESISEKIVKPMLELYRNV